ncbi:MAG: type II secretion system F family protein [Bdellovibrionales bacterium]
MSSLFANAWFVALVVGLTVFILCYVWVDRILVFAHTRSVGSKQTVQALLEKMLIDVDKKRLTLMLNLGSYGLGAAFFLLLWPNLIPGLALGVAAIFVGWTVPRILVQNMWEQRCNRLVDQMIDGLTIMGNGIRAGNSITQAMERVVENLKGPFAQELNLILNKTRLGMSVEDAIGEFAERIPRQDVQMLATAIMVLKETGGNLAETFTTIVLTIRERQKIEKKIQAMTAQGSMQAIIITLVPFVLILMFFMLDPNYIMPLFTKPLGWFFLLIMISLQGIGLVMMKKIVTIRV